MQFLAHHMKSNHWFYLGFAIDLITLLITVTSVFTMFEPTQGLDGIPNGSNISDGMTSFGRLMTWLIPLVLLALMAVAFWLKFRGKMLAANIMLWIPALPMLVMMVLWGGLALLFMLFGK